MTTKSWKHYRRDNHNNLILKRYLEEISQYPLLSKQEELALGRRIRTGDHKAFEKLIKSNLRFVVNFAKKFQGLNVSLEDLIDEGNIGLIEAAKRYNPDLNVKFISYAVWWIRQAIMNAIARISGIVKIPLKHINFIHRINLTIRDLSRQFGREPTMTEIAKKLDIKEDDLLTLLRASNNYISLDTPISDDEIKTYMEFLKQKNQIPIPEQILKKFFEKSITGFLNKLKEREKYIITKRFGLDGEEPQTLETIGQSLDISRERVRQIEKQAKKKLLRLFKTHRLADALN